MSSEKDQQHFPPTYSELFTPGSSPAPQANGTPSHQENDSRGYYQPEGSKQPVSLASSHSGMAQPPYNGAAQSQYNGMAQSQFNGVAQSQYNGVAQPSHSGMVQPQHNGMAQPQYNNMAQYNGMAQPQYNNMAQYHGMTQPQYNNMAQPQYNGMAQPQYNGMAQSQYNGMAQPQHNSMVQPQHNGMLQSQYSGMAQPQYNGTAQSPYSGGPSPHSSVAQVQAGAPAGYNEKQGSFQQPQQHWQPPSHLDNGSRGYYLPDVNDSKQPVSLASSQSNVAQSSPSVDSSRQSSVAQVQTNTPEYSEKQGGDQHSWQSQPEINSDEEFIARIQKFGNPLALDRQWSVHPSDRTKRRLPDIDSLVRLKGMMSRSERRWNQTYPSFVRDPSASPVFSEGLNFTPITCQGKGKRLIFQNDYVGNIMARRDVSPADWFQFLEDLVLSRNDSLPDAEALPLPIIRGLAGIVAARVKDYQRNSPAPASRVPRISETVDVWRRNFFHPRGLEIEYDAGVERIDMFKSERSMDRHASRPQSARHASKEARKEAKMQSRKQLANMALPRVANLVISPLPSKY